MSDIEASSVHLPINIWLANAALVHEDFVIDGGVVTKPTIQNLKDIQDNGTSLGDFLDDETHMFNEPRERIEVPVLTAVGPKLRDVKVLNGPEEVEIPIDAFTYALYAIMQGMDPDTAITNSQDIRFDNVGWEDDGGGNAVTNATYDKVATLLSRVESIDTIRFTLLAHMQPADPDLGDKYILCPKLTINMEQVQQMIQKSYYKQTIMFKSLILSDAELTRWQNILPIAKKTIGLYSFHIDEPAT